MFYSTPLKILSVEPSSFCNAKCPQCMRESQNGDYTFFKQLNLSKDFFDIYFPKQVVKNLTMVTLSGNMGDPAMNKHLPDILRWFRKQNPNIFLEVYTNGSIQKPEWWYELGNIIGTNGNVIFALDGLEDTNHIYRIGVSWHHLIANVKEYIKSGATSTWQFIPFEHNEHQVEAAEALSKATGFTNFKIKISHRDLLNQPQNVANAVRPPNNPKYQHPGKKLDFINFDKTENYLDSVNIKCYAAEDSNLYISADGLVFPCCHTASIVLLDDALIPEPYSWIKKSKAEYDLNEISLYKNNLESILSSNTFNKIKESWNLNMKQGRNPICAAICGKCNDSSSLIEVMSSR